MIVQFLLDSGLCVRDENGIKMGPARTHLHEGSPHRLQHHMNWRIKGLDRCSKHLSPEFFYSFPMVISENDFKLVRELIFELLTKVEKLVKPSKPEQLCCLNIDWFKF